MQGPIGTIELMHGYTYSGHPAACGALIATLQIYERETLFERARELETYWEEAVHMLRAGAKRRGRAQHRSGRRGRAQAD